MSGASEIKGASATIFRSDAAWGHRWPCSHGEPLSSRPKCYMWTGHSATINPVEGGKESSLACTAAVKDKTATAATPVAAEAMTIADKSCVKIAATNNKLAGLK